MNKTGILTEDERIARIEQDAKKPMGPTRRPVDAATLILLDRTGPNPRFLMGKRNPNLKFMPGMFVFPGGRSERADGLVKAIDVLDPAIALSLSTAVAGGASTTLPRRLALTAIRETFEETGIVLGASGPFDVSRAPAWSEFAATGHRPALKGLDFVARAITPPRRPRRFDTRFFVADSRMIAHQVPGVVSADAELTELAWLTIEDTVSLPLPGITRVVLSDLVESLASGALKPGGPVPFYYEKHRKVHRDIIRIA